MSEENQERKPLKLKLSSPKEKADENEASSNLPETGSKTGPANPATPAQPQRQKPPSLNLSKGGKRASHPTQAGQEKTKSETSPETEPEAEAAQPEATPEEKPKPRLKPRPTQGTSATPENPGEGPVEPEATETEPPQPPVEPKTENPEVAPDPENPFAAAKPSQPEDTPAKEEDPTPPPHSPNPDPGASHEPEPAAQSGANDPETKPETRFEREADETPTSGSPLVSIIIILLLLAILGGSGFGLWYVLSGDADAPKESEKSVAASPPAPEAPASNPITKAQEAISSVPVEALEAVTGSQDEASPLEETTAVAKEMAKEDAPPASKARIPARRPNPANGTAEADRSPQVDRSLVAPVSTLLGNLHIGGVRTGSRPMVIADGRNYSPGDLVDAETGLRFSGIRDEKLAFTDKNGVVYLKSF